MSQPTPYARQFDFTGWSTSRPNTPHPGVQIDAELNAVRAALNHALTNLALIQRDDTGLANGVVGIDQLSAVVQAMLAGGGFTVRGNWAPATAYLRGDIVSDSGKVYLVITDHNSSASLAADIASGYVSSALFEPHALLDYMDDLAASTGAGLVGSTGGITVQAALDLKAALASPTFTGTPAAPTAALGTDTAQIATTAFVQAAVQALLDAAPGTLDTLNELAAALGDDANFAATMTSALAAKAASADLAATGGAALIGTANFDGDTIPDGSNGQQALQALETAVEARPQVTNLKQYNPAGDGTTDDQTAVAAAVAAAYAAGDWLWWPDGTYLTTASIANFHDVKHFGPGVVKRGSDLFYVEPRSDQANTLYVATTGTADNDGLTTSQPMTIAAVKDALLNQRLPLEGDWTIELAAGTYTGATFDNITFDYILSRKPIIFQGPDVSGHPNVPTAIIDGSSGYGWYFKNRMLVEVKDIKFQDYTASTGLIAGFGTDLTTSNVHTYNCLRGIWASADCILTVPDGIFDGNSIASSMGIWSYNRCNHTIGDQSVTDPADMPLVKNCNRGVYMAESATGHANCAVEDCDVGYDVASCSRANVDNSDFKRCDLGIRVQQNAILVGTAAEVNFNLGGANACTATVAARTGGHDGINEGSSLDVRTESTDITVDTVTGSTSETHAKSADWSADRVPETSGGGLLARTVEIFAAGTKTGTAGTFSVITRMHTAASTGGTQVGGLSMSSTNSGSWEFRHTMLLSGSAVQESSSSGAVNGGTPRLARRSTTLAINDGVARFLNLNIVLGDAGDSVSVEMFTVRYS